MRASVAWSGVASRLRHREWLLAVLFAAAYGQWPLYSSNQNTYFVRGVAWATGGPLRADWFVSTTDPVPLFTAYVMLVSRWLSPAAFFFVHGALVAAYAACLMYLSRRALGWKPEAPELPVFVATLALLHSDALVSALSVVGSPLVDPFLAAMRLATEGVAGQPLLRHFHQPSAFGVLLLVGVCLFLQGRPRGAALTAGLATWFHPVYVPASALLVLLFASAEARAARYRRALATAGCWLAFALPPALYILVRFSPSSPELAAEATRVLVRERFPHHADPHLWLGWPTALQIVICLAALFLVRRDRKLYGVMAVLLAAASALTLAQVVTGSDALAMLLPWRVLILVVPVSSAILLAWACTVLVERWPSEAAASFGIVVLVGAAAAGLVTTVNPTRAPQLPQALLSSVSGRCSETDVYVIPPHWEDFRLATRCPVFVDRKSHPYKDVEVLEWRDRLRAASELEAAETAAARHERLEALASRWRVTHAIVEAESPEGPGWRVLELESGTPLGRGLSDVASQAGRAR